jgi:predicted ATPase
MLRREAETAKAWAERTITVCDEYLLPLLLSLGTFQRGWALAELDDLDEGIACMREGLAQIRATGAEMGSPFYAAVLGEALARAGRPEAGLDEIERGLATARQRGQSLLLSEILRLKGELLSMRSRSKRTEAEACFRDAIATAGKQGETLSKLRATTSLARLLAEKGETTKARTILRPAIDAVTEGHDLSDFRAATALLSDLTRH